MAVNGFGGPQASCITFSPGGDLERPYFNGEPYPAIPRARMSATASVE